MIFSPRYITDWLIRRNCIPSNCYYIISKGIINRGVVEKEGRKEGKLDLRDANSLRIFDPSTDRGILFTVRNSITGKINLHFFYFKKYASRDSLWSLVTSLKWINSFPLLPSKPEILKSKDHVLTPVPRRITGRNEKITKKRSTGYLVIKFEYSSSLFARSTDQVQAWMHPLGRELTSSSEVLSSVACAPRHLSKARGVSPLFIRGNGSGELRREWWWR